MLMLQVYRTLDIGSAKTPLHEREVMCFAGRLGRVQREWNDAFLLLAY